MNAPYPVPAPVAPPGAAVPPCLIVNPRSFRASRNGLAARAVAVANAHGAEVIQTHLPQELVEGLHRVLALGVTRLFVLSGDGTVQAICDYLAGLPAGTPLPQLMLLGGGRTNLTAADVGGSGRLLDKLDQAFRRAREGHRFDVEERCLLTVEQAPAPPRQGFFVAGALIEMGIRACHRHRDAGSSALHKGHLSTPWYLIKLAVLSLLGRSPLQAPELDIQAAGNGRLLGRTGVLIATTLLHRSGLFNPYAARGTGPMRLTAIASGAPGFWLGLLGILMGRFGRGMTLERGYLSGACEQVEVRGLSGYALDGEEFDTDPSRPVSFRPGLRLSFLIP